MPGSHAVGFMKRTLRDSARFDVPKTDSTGRLETRDRSRQLTIHIWYPAARGSASAMTFRDYMFSHMPDTVSEARRRDDEANRRRFFGEFGTVTDSAWATLLATRLLASRNATPAGGRFPLVVGQMRTLSNTVTNEYLASHGYVIAMIDGRSPEEPDPGIGLEVAERDMEFAVPQMRKLSFVDPGKLAALGFSGSGFSQLLFAMRHPDVDAVSDLESAIFDDGVFWPLSGGWGYQLTALRVPFLHMYSVPLSKRENRIADFEGMRYSQRYRYLVDAPGIHHWDFALEGMAASTVLGMRGENATRLRQAFETTNRYLLAFFNAHVKRDAAELAFLRRDPAANGAPQGLATIRELPAVTPAPSVLAFQTMAFDRGIQPALAMLDAARRSDPEAALFQEARLNGVAYRLFRNGKQPDGIALFRKIVEMFPGSSNAYDSLSEALETSGDRAAAAATARKGLEVLEREQLPDDRKAQLRELLQSRVTRLG
ncbi:MAG TPA: hypothetical protein VM076_19250 [Gemmatimonadaceae bacterium]|nr:hypothetical protein [Gemmatimonadaceae bacterium]